MARPRVVLVDDHLLFRSGVRAELGERVDVVGEAGDVDEAIAAVTAQRPDVVLLDVHLPGGGGAAVIQRLPDDVPSRFLALSVSDAAEDVIEVVRAGARGYVTKTINGRDTIHRVHREKSYRVHRKCAMAMRRLGWQRIRTYKCK